MNHDDIRHKLSEYIDGAVSADEQAIIEEHLGSCRECSDALGELQKALRHVRDLEEMNPPPWLTQKIMTAVREEAERKTGFFRKLFFPLPVKLPIQAVALLFLVVTAFYISQIIRPTMRFAEGPTEETIGRSAQSDPEGLPQSPEYKALDMQYSYRPVPPPVPLEEAPAPATISENAERKAPRAITRDKGREQAAELPGDSQKDYRAKSFEPQAKSLMPLTDQEPALTITVIVQDPETASRNIERAIETVNGSIIRIEQRERGTIIAATLKADNLRTLYNELKQIGEVREPDTVQLEKSGQITVRIESLVRH